MQPTKPAIPQQAQSIFKTGMEFRYPVSEHGPSLYGMLEALWTLVALAKGTRDKVWETATPGAVDAVAAAWARMGLLVATPDQQGVQLTKQGANVAGCAALLEYELAMIGHQLNGNATDPAMYAQLRNGLENYSNAYLSELLNWAALQVKHVADPLVLDYCGGNGAFVKRCCELNPNTIGWLIDKAPGSPRELADTWGITVREGDVLAAEDNPTEDLDNLFDLVIMSEILHCKGAEDRARMVADAYRMLRVGGVLIVAEQFPGLRLEWRLAAMTEAGHTLDKEVVAFEVQALPFKPTGYIEAFSHYAIAFTKEVAQ